MHVRRPRRAAAEFADWAASTARSEQRPERRQLQANSLKQSVPKDTPAYRLDDPDLFEDIATQQIAAGPGPGDRRAATTRSRPMLGKLTWAAIPFDQPIPLIAGAVVLVAILAVLVWVVVKGICPISGANGSPASTTSGSA